MEIVKDITEKYMNGLLTKKRMIEKALQSRYEMLDVKTFIEVIGHELPNLMPFDLMWDSFNNDIPIYLNNKFNRSLWV